MNKKLISLVKYNKTLVKMYKFIGNFLILLLKLFVRVDNNKILFVSFGGQKYDDSPKELYERMIIDNFFDKYKFVWGFTNPNHYTINKGTIVKIDTLKYFVEALSSKFWITNSSVERGLNLRRNETFEINTWHGCPLKKIGTDLVEQKNFKVKKSLGKFLYCSQSEFDREVFSRLFNTNKENSIISDLPRNDFLTQYSSKDVEYVKKKLNLSSDKKIILYAPTFREYDRDSLNACYLNPPIDLYKWKNLLGADYILLFRAHYEVVKILGIISDDFVIDVSKYPSLNELMIISDILISDYSSIYFDYSILEKPMLNFSYDLDTYIKQRGLYTESFNSLPCRINKTEDELIDNVINLNYELSVENTKKFKRKFAPNAGHASELVIKKLKEGILDNE